MQVVDVADGSVRSVGPSPAFDAEPSWSRDGSTIAFVSERDGEPTVYVVARDGSNVRRWIEGHDPVFDWKVDALAYVRKDGVWVEAGAIAPMDVVSQPDTIVDGPGRDRIFAGAESDTVLAKDGWRDSIDCGGGRDTVTADRFDRVAANCERVRR